MRCGHAGCTCEQPEAECASALEDPGDRAPQLELLHNRMLADRQPAGGQQRVAQLGFTPCTSGMAGPFPCRNVDLLSYLPLNEIGGNPSGDGSNDIWGWADPLAGQE